MNIIVTAIASIVVGYLWGSKQTIPDAPPIILSFNPNNHTKVVENKKEEILYIL